MNLNEMTVPELKALAYDLMVEIQNRQNGLNQVNTVIADKQLAEAQAKKEEGKKK